MTPKKRFSREKEKIDSNFTGIEKTGKIVMHMISFNGFDLNAFTMHRIAFAVRFIF